MMLWLITTLSMFQTCWEVCRLAQFVLAREDPQETFLKSIPKQIASLTIVYPVRQAML